LKLKLWLRCAGIRALKAVAQTVVSMLTVYQFIEQINWIAIISASLVAGIISLLSCIPNIPELKVKLKEEQDKRAQKSKVKKDKLKK